MLLSFSAIFVWRTQRVFPLRTSSIYYTSLRSVREGYRAAVLTIPFRYELAAQTKAELTKLLERSHGLATTVSIEQPVIMGHNPEDWKEALRSEGYIAVFVIFNLATTAEPDAHGSVVKRIIDAGKGRIPVIPIVDTSTYAELDKKRYEQRCDQWRTVLDLVGSRPLFLNFRTLDHEEVQKSVASRLFEYD